MLWRLLWIDDVNTNTALILKILILKYILLFTEWVVRAMAQAASRWPLTAEARVHPGPVREGFVVDKV
jgi:hypothetical protein